MATILIAHHEEIMRQFIGRDFNGSRHFALQSIAEFEPMLHLISGIKPNLLITSMPHDLGLDAIARFKQACPSLKLKVIVVTASADDEKIRQLKAAGADHVEVIEAVTHSRCGYFYHLAEQILAGADKEG